jgi:hypothetical protein
MVRHCEQVTGTVSNTHPFLEISHDQFSPRKRQIPDN